MALPAGRNPDSAPVSKPSTHDVHIWSDTPRKAGSLMSGAASKAVPRNVRLASLPAAVATPKGLKLSSRGQGHAFGARRPRTASLPILSTLKGSKLSSRGQGHAFGARRPRTASLPILSTLKGSNGSAPPGPRGFPPHRYRRFHLRLLTVFPLRGTPPRSNLFQRVATVSAVLTVGCSGGGRVTTILLWTRQRWRRVPSRLITCDCHGGITPEKSPRSEKR